MNNLETVPMVLEIARGSSLVFTSISADSASSTISRILDMFPTYDQERIRDLLANSLRAVICQKVISKIGGGVIIVQEVLVVNEAVKSIIATGAISSLNNIIQTSRGEGMVSFNNTLAKLIDEGKISREDALDSSSDRKSLEDSLK